MRCKPSYFLIVISLGLFATLAWEMESSSCEEEKNFYSIIVPGLNGNGGELFEFHRIVNTPRDQTIRLQTVSFDKCDFGQHKCTTHLEMQLPSCWSQPYNQFLLFAVSQGTATLLNSLAKLSLEEQEIKIKFIFLEAALGSGNNAIIHFLKGNHFTKLLTILPFARSWLPWATKLVFPHYNPLGPQALKSAQRISPKIPIIIMHHVHDPILPIDDARKLYDIFYNQGNPVYFFEINHTSNYDRHTNILSRVSVLERLRIMLALQAIFKNHGAPYKSTFFGKEIDLAPINFTQFQPSISDSERSTDNDTVREPLLKRKSYLFWKFIIFISIKKLQLRNLDRYGYEGGKDLLDHKRERFESTRPISRLGQNFRKRLGMALCIKIGLYFVCSAMRLI